MNIIIHERFLTWQGEGVHMGRKAYFLRTYGCPLKCDFCDSAGTWHPDFKPEGMERLDTGEIIAAVVDSKASVLVITGGEPAMHDWKELIRYLHRFGVNVHIETSGAFPLKGEFDWVTLSPKRAKEPCVEAVREADEFKLIIETPEDIWYWNEILQVRLGHQFHSIRNGSLPPSNPVWLHPEWSQRENPVVLEAINRAVVEYGDPYRVGYQLHKLYRPDQRDALCRADVPLGGGQKLEPTKLPLEG